MKKILISLILAIAAVSSSAASFTAVGPKPVQGVIPFAPGGTVDMIFREFQMYSDSKGVNIIGNYRPGALGVLGIQSLAGMPADGNSVALALVDSLAAYKIATGKEIDPNTVLFMHQSVFGFVVRADSKLNTIEDVVAKMKSDKKGVSIGFSTPIQNIIITNVFVKQAKVDPDRVIYINYGKGGAQTITDVISGTIDVGLAAVAQWDPLIKGGKLKLIAVDSAHRLKLYPDVPTLASVYPNLPVINRGICMMVNTSTPDQLDFWKKFINEYKSSARFKDRAHTEFYEIKNLTPAEITTVVEENVEMLKQIK